MEIEVWWEMKGDSVELVPGPGQALRGDVDPEQSRNQPSQAHT